MLRIFHFERQKNLLSKAPFAEGRDLMSVVNNLRPVITCPDFLETSAIVLQAKNENFIVILLLIYDTVYIFELCYTLLKTKN